MTTCERMSDRMPSVAAGHAAWTPEEREHLDACVDCSTVEHIDTELLNALPEDGILRIVHER